MPQVTPAITVSQATHLLAREARLLDQRRFDDWLALYADNAGYWVPARRADGQLVSNTANELSVLRMDRALLRDWVVRMKSGHAVVEPVGATRLLGAVDADDADANTFHAAWMMQIFAHGNSALYSGRSRVVLTGLADGTLRILHKEVHLLQDSVRSGYLPLI